MKAFYCEHNDPTESQKRGIGIAIAQNVITNPNDGTTSVWISVLWDNLREISPDLHAPSELKWIALQDHYDAIEDDEEEAEGEEEVEEEEDPEAVEVVDGNFTEDEEEATGLDH